MVSPLPTVDAEGGFLRCICVTTLSASVNILSPHGSLHLEDSGWTWEDKQLKFNGLPDRGTCDCRVFASELNSCHGKVYTDTVHEVCLAKVSVSSCLAVREAIFRASGGGWD